MFLNVIRKKMRPMMQEVENQKNDGKDRNVDSANFEALRSKITRIWLENMT